MKLSTLLLTALFLTAVAADAQTVTPTVVASAGGSNTAGGITLSWTLGELAVTTLQAGDLYITQGFHQPPLGTTSVAEENSLQGVLATHPNPVSSYLSVRLPEASGAGSFTLVDLLGRTVSTAAPAPGESLLTLDLEGVAAGTYVARYSSGGRVWTTVVTVRR